MEPILLEGGTIRTLDPAAPVVERLAIATGGSWRSRRRTRGAWISRAAACCPASTTRTCTSPPGRWPSARCGWRGRARSPRRSGGSRTGWRAPARRLAARARLARRRLDRAAVARGAGRGRAGHAGDPDLEGLPLAVAQLGRARARRRRPRRARRRGRARRVRRAARRAARERGLALSRPPRGADRWTRCSTPAAPGCGIAAARGVTAIHDKDGWLGSLELFQRLREAAS